MAYATAEDVKSRFGEELEQNQPSPKALDRALDDASAEIEGYLRGRYPLPLKKKHKLLTQIACDIARDNLYKDGSSEAIRARAAEARAKLKALARGVARLDEPTFGRRVAGMSQVEAPPRRFTAGSGRTL